MDLLAPMPSWPRLIAGRIPATNRFKSARMMTKSDLQCTSCANACSLRLLTSVNRSHITLRLLLSCPASNFVAHAGNVSASMRENLSLISSRLFLFSANFLFASVQYISKLFAYNSEVTIAFSCWELTLPTQAVGTNPTNETLQYTTGGRKKSVSSVSASMRRIYHWFQVDYSYSQRTSYSLRLFTSVNHSHSSLRWFLRCPAMVFDHLAGNVSASLPKLLESVLASISLLYSFYVSDSLILQKKP